MEAARETRLARRARVVDLGCGEGRLLRRLLAEPRYREIVGVDVSPRPTGARTNAPGVGSGQSHVRLTASADSARRRVRPARTAESRPCGWQTTVGANLAAYAGWVPGGVTQAHATRGVVTQW